MVNNFAHIHFQCSTCLKRFKADPAKAGMKVKCPACRSTIRIPGRSDLNNRVPFFRMLLQKLTR